MKIRFFAILAAVLVAASMASCGNGGKGETTTDKNNIHIESSSHNDKTTNEETTEKKEETSQKGPQVDRTSDPGEFTYVSQNDTVYVINKINNLPFRSGTFEFLGEFKNGTALQRIGISEDGRWSKVVHNGVEGYVAAQYIGKA